MGANRSVLLSDAIDDFLRHRKSQDYARSTVRQDEGTLRKFLGITGNVWLHMLNGGHVTRFFEEVAKTQQSATIRNTHTRLSVFFEWARETDRMPRSNNPMYGRRKPKPVEKERNRLPRSQFAQLLDAAEARDLRDRAAVAMLLYSLARDQEIADVRIRDVRLSEGKFRVRIWKTRQEDDMPICVELDEELRRWLTFYTEQVGHLEPHYYLLPARRTRPLFENGRIYANETLEYRPERPIGAMGNCVNPILESVGFPVKDENGKGLGEGAHTIRRSGARALFDLLLEEGIVDSAMEIVQSMLHHKNLTQTQKYIGFEPSRHKRDDLIRGRRLYAVGENVVAMRRSNDGDSEDRAASL